MRVLAGRYHLQAVIGEGSAATVYKAYDQTLEAQCAVKALNVKSKGRTSRRLRRFQDEAKLLARLRHPFILPVFDLDVGDEPFIVTALCPSGSLRKRLEQGPLPAAQAIEFAVQTCEALHHAHERFVVHRDVKPGNILIGPEGTALLADFGVAMQEDGLDRLTLEGAALGTYSFMAPEQRIDSTDVTWSADQYSLAATLYALLTNESPVDLFIATAESPRWWGVPAPLLPVLQRAMKYRPEHRFPSMNALADALREVAEILEAGEVEGGAPPAIAATGSVAPHLIDWYRSSLGHRAEQLRDALEGWEQSVAGSEPALRRIAHMLRGSGASYGFPIVSEAAAAAEDAEEVDLANRMGELLYVVRHIASLESAVPKRQVLCVLQRANLRKTIALILPDATIVASWSEARHWLEQRSAQVVVATATPETQEQLSRMRTTGVDIKLVLVGGDAGGSSTWKLGAQAVLPEPLDPLRLASTIRGLFDVSRDTGRILPMASFHRAVAKRLAEATGTQAMLFAVRLDGVAPDGIAGKMKHGAPFVFGESEGCLVAFVPTSLSLEFSQALPDEVGSRAGIVSADVRRDRTSLSEQVSWVLQKARSMAPGTKTHHPAIRSARQVAIVEDDPAMAELVAQIVQSAGHESTWFSEGAEALSRIRENPPDLLVLDVELPTLDGLELLQQIRADSSLSELPVVMLTARSQGSDVALALELGATDHVAKPFDVQVLSARIKALLRRTRGG